ncbi:MAG: hypothetical protein ACTSRH_14375 [Promethearchaeota archaeon]
MGAKNRKYLPYVYEKMKELEWEEFHALFPNIPEGTFRHYHPAHKKKHSTKKRREKFTNIKVGSKNLCYYLFSFDSFRMEDYAVIRLVVKKRNYNGLHYFLKFKYMGQNEDFRIETKEDLKELTKAAIEFFNTTKNAIYAFSYNSRPFRELLIEGFFRKGETDDKPFNPMRYLRSISYLKNHIIINNSEIKPIVSNIHIID